MKEVFASDLYDTGRFYERTSKPHAAHIYYTRILAKYPETKVSQLANKRLTKIKYQPKEQAVEGKNKEPLVEPVQPSPLLQLPVQGVTVDAAEPQGNSESTTGHLSDSHEDLK
jgi:hypothetical protein